MIKHRVSLTDEEDFIHSQSFFSEATKASLKVSEVVNQVVLMVAIFVKFEKD